jgi:hypothetical protein
VSCALLPLSIIVFVLFPSFPFAVMGLLLKASSCRARQFLSGVPWAEISVQIRQPSKELVVQRGAQQRPQDRSKTAAPAHPRQSQYLWTLKILLEQHSITCAAQKPDFLCYSAHFSGLCCDEQPRKTALDDIPHDKTLSVPEAIFRRESLPLSMHGFIKRMTIKLTPFSVRPYTAAHFCGASTHTPGHSRSRQQGERRTADERGRM